MTVLLLMCWWFVDVLELFDDRLLPVLSICFLLIPLALAVTGTYYLYSILHYPFPVHEISKVKCESIILSCVPIAVLYDYYNDVT